ALSYFCSVIMGEPVVRPTTPRYRRRASSPARDLGACRSRPRRGPRFSPYLAFFRCACRCLRVSSSWRLSIIPQTCYRDGPSRHLGKPLHEFLLFFCAFRFGFLNYSRTTGHLLLLRELFLGEQFKLSALRRFTYGQLT
ncbi:MAG: hypothetical protein WB711_22395, partial [Terriglobales bacterium]